MDIWRRRTERPEDWPDWAWEQLEREVSSPTPPPKWAGVPGLFKMANPGHMEWRRARLLGPSERVPTPPWLRQMVIDRDGLVCGICGGDVEADDVHIDHVLPASKGGPTVASNLQVSHSRCNLDKGASV